mgnify:CR=1 FL=1
MELWQELVRKSVSSVDELVKIFGIDAETSKKMDSLFIQGLIHTILV